MNVIPIGNHARVLNNARATLAAVDPIMLDVSLAMVRPIIGTAHESETAKEVRRVLVEELHHPVTFVDTMVTALFDVARDG